MPAVAVRDLVPAHGFDHDVSLFQDVQRRDGNHTVGARAVRAAEDAALLRLWRAKAIQVLAVVGDGLDDLSRPRLAVLGRRQRVDRIRRPALALVFDLTGRATDTEIALRLAFGLRLCGGAQQ